MQPAPLLTGFLAIWLSISYVTADHECCPGSYIMSGGSKCEDGSRLKNINCTSSAYFLIPELVPEDAFHVLDNGSLVHNNDTIEPGSFCVTSMEMDESDLMTERVALVCFDISEYEESSAVQYDLNGVCFCISAIFLIFTLFIYAILPEVRDLQGKVLMCYMASLTVSYISLAILNFSSDFLANDAACIGTAFFTYFWMFSAFIWLHNVAFNIWLTVKQKIKIGENNLFAIYCVASWGISSVFFLTAVITFHMPQSIIKPNFGDVSCWFVRPSEHWFFLYGPMLLILISNIVYFIWTGLILWRNFDQSLSERRLKPLRFKCLLYLKLFLIMGLLWIFEIASYVEGNHSPFWYVTDFLNSLQGLLIFLLVVVFRKRVRRALAQRHYLPVRCAEGVDEESEAILDKEETNHSPVNNP